MTRALTGRRSVCPAADDYFETCFRLNVMRLYLEPRDLPSKIRYIQAT